MRLLTTVTISLFVFATVVACADERPVIAAGAPPLTSGNGSQTVTIARDGSRTPTMGLQMVNSPVSLFLRIATHSLIRQSEKIDSVQSSPLS
jgi:hypothetical protein